jgi:hypothetical protein
MLICVRGPNWEKYARMVWSFNLSGYVSFREVRNGDGECRERVFVES